MEEGKFVASLDTIESGTNSMIYNHYLDLLFLGCDNGTIELVDLRQGKRPGLLKIEEKENIRVLQNSKSPYEFYCGTSEGLVRLYDVRYNKFISEKRHPYMIPINSI